MAEISIHLCILAAGAGTRFGSVKQIQTFNKQPMLMHVHNQIDHPLIVKKSIVVGAHYERVIQAIPSNTDVIEAQDWQIGLSASIAAAVDAMSHNATHLMLALADQPLIQFADYDRLISACLNSPENITAAFYASRCGVPAIFPSADLILLRQLKGDKGAGKLLNTMENVIPVNIPNAVNDIDTPEDLNRIERQFKAL